MTGKNKIDLQAENVKQKEELADMTAKYENLRLDQESLQRRCQFDKDKKKSTFACSRCDSTFLSLNKLKEHKDNEHKLETEFLYVICVNMNLMKNGGVPHTPKCTSTNVSNVRNVSNIWT